MYSKFRKTLSILCSDVLNILIQQTFLSLKQQTQIKRQTLPTPWILLQLQSFRPLSINLQMWSSLEALALNLRHQNSNSVCRSRFSGRRLYNSYRLDIRAVEIKSNFQRYVTIVLVSCSSRIRGLENCGMKFRIQRVKAAVSCVSNSISQITHWESLEQQESVTSRLNLAHGGTS